MVAVWVRTYVCFGRLLFLASCTFCWLCVMSFQICRLHNRQQQHEMWSKAEINALHSVWQPFAFLLSSSIFFKIWQQVSSPLHSRREFYTLSFMFCLWSCSRVWCWLLDASPSWSAHAHMHRALLECTISATIHLNRLIVISISTFYCFLNFVKCCTLVTFCQFHLLCCHVRPPTSLWMLLSLNWFRWFLCS